MDFEELFAPLADEWRRFIAESDPSTGWRYNEKRIQALWASVEEKRGRPGAQFRAETLVSSGLRLMLFDEQPALVAELFGAAIECANAVDEPGMLFPDYKHLSTRDRNLEHAPQKLEAYLMRAIAETAQQGLPPSSRWLEQGAEVVAASYRGLRRPFGRDAGKIGVLLATLCAFLCGRIDLARELLALRKTQPEQPRQFAWLKNAAKTLWTRTGEFRGISVERDGELAREYFAIFNVYRIPDPSQNTRALGEWKLLMSTSFIDTYLYAWLYLKLLNQPPIERIDRDELRRLITR